MVMRVFNTRMSGCRDIEMYGRVGRLSFPSWVDFSNAMLGGNGRAAPAFKRPEEHALLPFSDDQ